MSRKNQKNTARRRGDFTGETHQQALREMRRLVNGPPWIVDAQNPAQLHVESVLLHRLLHGAQAQWPGGARPEFPLFVESVSPSADGLRVVVPVEDVRAFSATLALRPAGGARSASDEVAIHYLCSNVLHVKTTDVVTGVVELRCSWNELYEAGQDHPYVSTSSSSVRFPASSGVRLNLEEQAALSGLLRRIALFGDPGALDWLFGWHQWLMLGRVGARPPLPESLVCDLTDENFGLRPVPLRVLGIDGGSPLSSPATGTLTTENTHTSTAIHTEPATAKVSVAPLDRYLGAPDSVKPVLDAAVDLRRYGYGPLVSEEVLYESSTHYFNPRKARDKIWFNVAIDYASTPLRELPGGLITIRSRPGKSNRKTEVFQVSDFIVQHALSERASFFPPQAVFEAIRRFATESESLRSVARRAESAGRRFIAARLYYRALEMGHLESAWDVANILELAGDRAGAIEILEADLTEHNENTIGYLVYLLSRDGELGRIEHVFRRTFDAGNPMPLIEAEYGTPFSGDPDRYHDMVDRIVFGGGVTPEERQARTDLLREGREDTARLLRPRLIRNIAYLDLSDEAKREKHEQTLQLVSTYEKDDNATAARSTLVDAVTAEIMTLDHLCDFYSRHHEQEKAEAIWSFGIDAEGEPAAPWTLKNLR
jgi:hypothetical protein